MNRSLIYKLKNACIILFVAGLLHTGCNKEREFTIGEQFIESRAHVKVIDTFSIEFSTVRHDSVITSAQEVLLTGNYRDDIFGRVYSNSFFMIGLPDFSEMEDDEEYDSMSLILKYNGYCYGDTLQNISISVHQLLHVLNPDDDGYFYNTSIVGYEDIPVGTGNFESRTDTAKTIAIRMQDDLGQELFTKLLTDDDVVSSESNFLSFFKGLAIIVDTNGFGAITGFKAGEGEINLRLYTHYIDETYKQRYYDFPLIYSENQFNQIHSDFNNTSLRFLTNQRNDIISDSMNNKAFIQGGTGLMARICFPYMSEILLLERGVVVEAQLIFAPDKTSCPIHSLPEDLILYNTNKNNSLGTALYNDDGYLITPALVIDDLYNENTTYTFDVTRYFSNELNDLYFDVQHGLLMSLSTEQLLAGLERLVIETKDPKPKLKIYYLTY